VTSKVSDIDFKALDNNKGLPVDPALDRRRQIYKNVRRDIDEEEKRNKQFEYKRKMTELEKKVAQRDEDRKI